MKKFIAAVCLFASVCTASAFEVVSDSVVLAPKEIVVTGVRDYNIANIQDEINNYLGVTSAPDTDGLMTFDAIRAQIDYLLTLPVRLTSEWHPEYKDGLSGADQLIDLMAPDGFYTLKIINQTDDNISLPLSIFVGME